MAATSSRFWIFVEAQRFGDLTNVEFQLYHRDPLLEAVYRRAIPKSLNATDPYLRSAIDQTFSAEEVAALRDWFAMQEGCSFVAEPVEPLRGDEVGVGSLVDDESSGVWDLSQLPGFPLSIRVAGRYELVR